MKILYFSNVNWNWIKQRPHFLSSELAKMEDNRVTFLSLTPFLKQKKSKFSNQENLMIRDLYSIPFSFKVPFIRWLNRIIVSVFIEKEFDVVVLTHPMQLDYLKTFKYKTLVYDCMDNIPEFYNGNVQKDIIEKEKGLCFHSDLVLVSSEYLRKKLIENYGIREKTLIIRNAINSNILNYSKINVNLKKPNIGYIGTIEKWFDVETVLWIAENFRNLTIYLIGPVTNDIKDKLRKDNIIFVGKVDHDIVISYIREMDKFLIPFIRSPLIEAVDPVKIYEFLAFNKTVISSFWPELEHFGDSICFYRDKIELTNLISDEKVNINGSDLSFVDLNNWSSRSIEIIEALKFISK